MRHKELEQLKEFTHTTTCYSKYIANCLNDMYAEDCGKCCNCTGHDEFPVNPSDQSVVIANEYLNRLIITIEPRKQWAATLNEGAKKIPFQNKTGICLCKYGDQGYGELVKYGKYPQNHREPKFADELVGKSREILSGLVHDNDIRYLTCVPSLRSDIVKDFSKRLAESLHIEFIELLYKTIAEPQKEMENSSHQMCNARQSFHVIEVSDIPDKVLLIDDIVDSKWTLTVCGYKLMERGCQEVYPFALADSSQNEE